MQHKNKRVVSASFHLFSCRKLEGTICVFFRKKRHTLITDRDKTSTIRIIRPVDKPHPDNK